MPIRVCFPFVGDDVGGSHISALKLIQNLDRSQVEPIVVLQQPAGPLAVFLERMAVPFIALPLSRMLPVKGLTLAGTAAYLATSVRLMRRFIRQGQFDVVHTNDGRTHVNWGLAARLAGVPLVWHHRGDPDAKGANMLAPFIANRMVTVSRFSRPSRPIVSMNKRLRVIHSPFDPPARITDRRAAKTALLSELGLQQGTHVLSFIGGLIDRKRPLLFIDIVERFCKKHPEIPVVGCIFGAAPPDSQELEAAARARCAERGLGQVVRFMGFRNPIEPYLAATDILVVPAVGEPFGRTLIEAMFLGTPVVATDHGGNPEAIDNERTGFLVEPEHADAFMEPLRALLADARLWMRVSQAALAQANRSYSTQHHVDMIMDTYAGAMRRSVRRGDRRDLTAENIHSGA